MSLETVIRAHRRDVLPPFSDEKVRIMIHRKHLWSEFLHKLQNGFDVNKPLKVTFVGKPGVDEGGPFREFLFLLITAISQNNTLLLKLMCQSTMLLS